MNSIQIVLYHPLYPRKQLTSPAVQAGAIKKSYTLNVQRIEDSANSREQSLKTLVLEFPECVACYLHGL